MKITTIFKTGLALSLFSTVHIGFADFATCPSAASAQIFFNTAADNLQQKTPVVAPSGLWLSYQTPAGDNFTTIDYFVQNKVPNALGDHVKYLATFIQGEPGNYDTATVRRCYYPGTPGIGGTGSLDSSGNPVNTQVLALEYGPGIPPGPIAPTKNISISANLVFPTGVTAPATVNSYTVTLTNPNPGPGLPATYSGTSTSGASASIANVAVSASVTTSYAYTYTATGIVINGQDYCATPGTANLSGAVPAFAVEYTACSTPPAPPAGSGNVYGYYTNWSIYARSFKPSDIPYSSLSVILYAFEEIGSCASHDPQDGSGAVPFHDCYKYLPNQTTSDFTGIQDYQLHSSDPNSDYPQGAQPAGNNGTLPAVITAAHAAGKKVLVSIGGYSLSDQITDMMNDTAISTCKVAPPGQEDPGTAPGARPGVGAVQLSASSPAIRTAFINGLWSGGEAMLKNYQFDGVDVDFEPNGNHWTGMGTDPNCDQPVSDQIIQNYAQFLVDLKAALTNKQPGRDKLTIALTADPVGIARIASVTCPNPTGGTESCMLKIANAVDTINIMAYDYHGAWEKNGGGVTNYASPLYADSAEPKSVLGAGIFNIDQTVQAFLNAGVPASKLILGIPAYVRLESGVNGTQPQPGLPAGLYMNFTGNPTGQWAQDVTGVFDYKCIMAIVGKITAPAGCTPSAIPGSADFVRNLTLRTVSGKVVGLSTYTPNAGGWQGPIFLSMDAVGDSTIDTLTPKINYVKSKGLDGVMIWELSGDVSPVVNSKYSLAYNASQQLSTATEAKK